MIAVIRANARMSRDALRLCRPNQKTRMLPSAQSGPRYSSEARAHRHRLNIPKSRGTHRLGNAEDGSDERGRHHHEWEDHRPMGSLVGGDNDGSSCSSEGPRRDLERSEDSMNRVGEDPECLLHQSCSRYPCTEPASLWSITFQVQFHLESLGISW